MNDVNALKGRRIGSVTPVLIRGEGPPIDEKLERLQSRAADVDDRRPGWHETRPVPGIPTGLLTAWGQFSPLTSRLGEEIDDLVPLPVADLPLEGIEGRLLVIGTTDEYQFRDVLAKYAEAANIGADRFARIPIDGELLKLIFQAAELYDVLRAVEGTERSIPAHYKGETRIKTPEDYDVRDSQQFEAVLDQPWKMIRIIPRPEAFGMDSMTPSVELSADKGSIRMWREWEDAETLDFLRRFCSELLKLSEDELEEDLLRKAAAKPYSQPSLSEFYSG